MAKAEKKKLKATPPRLADVKDLNIDISAGVSLSIISDVMEAAVTELGRQLGKNTYHRPGVMAAVKFASDLHESMKDLQKYDNFAGRSTIAASLGYSSDYWQSTNCDERNVDFGDLYLESTVTFAVAYQRAAKPTATLKKLGVR